MTRDIEMTLLVVLALTGLAGLVVLGMASQGG
jgi:hypothetical protein